MSNHEFPIVNWPEHFSMARKDARDPTGKYGVFLGALGAPTALPLVPAVKDAVSEIKEKGRGEVLSRPAV
jgi:hypothetical protein